MSATDHQIASESAKMVNLGALGTILTRPTARFAALRLRWAVEFTHYSGHDWNEITMGLIVATKAFFKLLFNRELSESFEKLASGTLPATQPKLEKPQPAAKASPPKPARSDALSLLSALQREARLVDLVSESLGEYTDEQVGSAAREVLEESGKVLQRMFALQPLASVADGESMTTPDSFDPAEFRLTGNVSGEPPFQGTVAHHGWKATKCEVPQWSGKPSARMIVAPVELEIG